jgi:hypothetical protein
MAQTLINNALEEQNGLVSITSRGENVYVSTHDGLILARWPK